MADPEQPVSLDGHRLSRKPVVSATHAPLDGHHPTTPASLLSPLPYEQPTHFNAHQQTPEPKRKSRLRTGWWWFEIGGCLMGIVGCALLVFVLKTIDQKSRDSWDLRLEPNTILAIISTISRTALMGPVVACISQLKWRHFQRRAHPLSHLDIIDRSSRGPWGSFQLLYRLGRANIVISLLAIITILSLVIGPSVQQVLETRTRQVKLDSAVAKVAYATKYTTRTGAANGYFGLTYDYGTPSSGGRYSFVSALARGVVDPVQPEFSCPGERCSFPDFTTLGVCADVQDITDDTSRDCSQIWYPDARVVQSSKPSELWAVNCTYKLPEIDFTGSNFELTYETKWTFYNLTAVADPRTLDIEDPQYLRTSSMFGYLAHPGKTENMPENAHRSVPAVVAEILSTGPRPRSSPAGPPEVKIHRVSFYYCAQTFSSLAATPGGLSSGEATTTEVLMRLEKTADSEMETFIVPSSGEAMLLSSHSMNLFRDFFASWLRSAQAGSDFSASVTLGSSPSIFGLDNTLGPWMWHNGVERAAANIATTLSSLIRNEDVGDNQNATSWEGEAFQGEAFFHVHWWWLSVILFETLCVTILLMFSVWLSWRDNLLKDSTFALLVHGLAGWETVHAPEPETADSLNKLSQGMVAKLESNEEGLLKFCRQSTEGNRKPA